MFDIKYSVLSFSLEIQCDCMLGESKVSALRGILGESLAITNCFYDLDNRECKKCYLKNKCLGNIILNTEIKTDLYFQSDKSISPLIFRCHNNKRNFQCGDILNFTLIVLGDNTAYIPYIIQAYEYAGNFLGINKNPFSILNVKNEFGEVLFDGYKIRKDKIVISTVEEYVLARKRFMKFLRGIRLVTPLSYKANRQIQRNIDGEGFKTLIERRLLTLNALEGHTIKALDLAVLDIEEANVKWFEYDRHSNRQKRTMTMGGIIGYFEINYMDEEQLDYLIAGELLHIGKSTAFGLGQYEIF